MPGPKCSRCVANAQVIQRLIALTNVTDQAVRVQIPVERLGEPAGCGATSCRGRGTRPQDGVLSVVLRPYGWRGLSITMV